MGCIPNNDVQISRWSTNIKMIYKYQHDLQIFWWSAIIMMVCKYYDGLQILWWFILSVKKSLQRNLHRCSLNIVNGITDTGMEYFNSINNIHQTLAKKQCSEQKTNVLTKSTHWKVGFLNDQSHISSTAEQKAWSKFNLGPIKTWTSKKMQRESSAALKLSSWLITYCCKFYFYFWYLLTIAEMHCKLKVTNMRYILRILLKQNTALLSNVS